MELSENINLSIAVSSATKENGSTGMGGPLQFSPITLKEDYCKEWNITSSDFICLTRNGELVNNSLYRIGGLGADVKQDYFLLLKHVEAIYDFDFIKKCYPQKSKKELELQRKHLESRWCIIDKNGIEKKEFDQFKSPYIKKGSCLYSLNSNYYNIETGQFYCYSSEYVESSEYIFLQNSYDKDESKRGVLKINKKDGSHELFSGT